MRLRLPAVVAAWSLAAPALADVTPSGLAASGPGWLMGIAALALVAAVAIVPVRRRK